LPDPLLQNGFFVARAGQDPSGILALPVVEKTGGKLMVPADLRRGADSAQELLNDLALELGTE
jgi:hypothetical protein